jgi:hypothetical protein
MGRQSFVGFTPNNKTPVPLFDAQNVLDGLIDSPPATSLAASNQRDRVAAVLTGC